MVVMVMTHHLVVVHSHLPAVHFPGRHLRIIFFSAKAGTARPSETTAAKAIANLFIGFLLGSSCSEPRTLSSFT
jgi:hypothetical protein